MAIAKTSCLYSPRAGFLPIHAQEISDEPILFQIYQTIDLLISLLLKAAAKENFGRGAEKG